MHTRTFAASVLDEGMEAREVSEGMVSFEMQNVLITLLHPRVTLESVSEAHVKV